VWREAEPQAERGAEVEEMRRRRPATWVASVWSSGRHGNQGGELRWR
jgi:hypothetical protein